MKFKFATRPAQLLGLIMIIAFGTIVFYACKKNNKTEDKVSNERLNDFTNSKDFKSQVAFAGLTIDEPNSKVTFYEGNQQRPVIHLVLKKNDKIVAIVDAIKNTNKNISLPNDGKYFMLFRDVSNFDFNTLAGNIKIIDLNYDSHVINQLSYNKGVNVSSRFNALPISILKKYENVIIKNKVYLSTKNKNSVSNLNKAYKMSYSSNNLTPPKVVPCDANHNGDLSFSECYACMNGACQTNSDCYTLCYGLGDVVAWVTTGIPYCQASIGAACIWLAIEYSPIMPDPTDTTPPPSEDTL